MLGNVFNVYCCFTKLKTTYNLKAGNAGVPSLLVPASTRTLL